MFYTLGDYRDICVGVKEDVIKALEASGEKDTNIHEIEAKIKKHINSVSQQTGTTGPPKTDSVEQRKNWWQTHGPDIWHGMICALTHKTETPGDVDEDVKRAFFGENNGNEPIKYNYKNVQLEEETNGAKGQTASPSSDTPLLSEFISRSPYFRWLEEWGENFCKERTKRLEKIKDDCYKDDGSEKQYSGDGETCNEILPKNDGTVRHLEGPSCANSCSSYRKWIKTKRTEYEKQKDRYKTESVEAESDNELSTRLQSLSDAEAFLQKLGPCKKDNENGKGNKTIFYDNGDTFKHTQYCDPCSEFKINCHNGNCIGDLTKGKCQNNKITANDIIDDKN
ncbi:hypothetical protein PFTANZ_06204, partial [Plasmodium falciparum Tanzania (2000708)]